MPGPRKTPRHLKLLRGTSQPCRDVAPSTAALPALDTAIAPAWMTDITAVAEFKRLAAVLTVNKLLTAGNTALLAHLVMIHARLMTAWTTSATPSAALMTVYRRMCSDLGLLSMAVPVAKPGNKFANNAKPRRGER